MSSERMRRPDWIGRGIGLAVFLGGIVLLVMVFVQTSQLEKLRPTGGAKPVWDQLGASLGVSLAQLFIEGLVASWIAGRGAQFYAASGRALPEDRNA